MLQQSSISSLIALVCFGSVSMIESSLTQAKAGIQKIAQTDAGIISKGKQLLSQQNSTNEIFEGILQSCSRSNSLVKCEVTLIAKEDVNGLRVYCNRGTRLFDPIGNVYACQQVSIGERKSESVLISQRFPQKTPVKATYIFKDIPPETTEFNSLEVVFQNYGQQYNYYLKFQNINIKN